MVRALPGGQVAAQALVERLGGTVTRSLPIIDGFAATVPDGALATLRSTRSILSVTSDVSGHVMSVDPTLGYDAENDLGTLFAVTKLIGAQDAWKKGWTGKGVDVALIDTGVAPVKGLTSGNVVNGPDLSFDSQRADLRYLDAYGHGTHMASIIAGRDVAGAPESYESTKNFNGVAPDARIINIKVGASDGAADVSQVIAAIDWVAQHAHDPGLNIRVLNLSFGTDSTQDYHLDPLAYAAQVAWRKGVLVVVAGGNDGTSNVQLANPALDGNLLAVGAEDPMGTYTLSDDTIPAFSNRGTTVRHVDIVAPGVHVLGLRVPNGLVDQAYPSARVGTRFFRGSGTSQSTAVVSGAAALLFQRYPSLTPQQAKMILGYGATWILKGTKVNSGAGILNVPKAMGLAGSSTTVALASIDHSHLRQRVGIAGALPRYVAHRSERSGAHRREGHLRSLVRLQDAGRRQPGRHRLVGRRVLERVPMGRFQLDHGRRLGRRDLDREHLDRITVGGRHLDLAALGGRQLGRRCLGVAPLGGQLLGLAALGRRQLELTASPPAPAAGPALQARAAAADTGRTMAG